LIYLCKYWIPVCAGMIENSFNFVSWEIYELATLGESGTYDVRRFILLK